MALMAKCQKRFKLLIKVGLYRLNLEQKPPSTQQIMLLDLKQSDNIKISQTGGNITVALTNDINVTKVTAGTVVAGNRTRENATLGGAGHTVKVENGTNVDMGVTKSTMGDGVKDSDAANCRSKYALDQVAGSPAKINELNNR